MNRENESGDILADILKTAEDLSKEADWKSKLLAPALGLGMALAPGATPAQGQQPKAPHSQTQQVKKPQVNQAQLEEEFKSNLKSLYQEYIRRVEVARQDKNDYEKRVQNESATAIGNAGFTPAEASDFIEKAEARFKGQVKLYRDEYKSDLADELDNYNTQGGDGDRAATILKDHAYVPRLD